MNIYKGSHSTNPMLARGASRDIAGGMCVWIMYSLRTYEQLRPSSEGRCREVLLLPETRRAGAHAQPTMLTYTPEVLGSYEKNQGARNTLIVLLLMLLHRRKEVWCDDNAPCTANSSQAFAAAQSSNHSRLLQSSGATPTPRSSRLQVRRAARTRVGRGREKSGTQKTWGARLRRRKSRGSTD